MMASGDITITPGKTDTTGDVAYETGMFKNSIAMKTGGAPVTDEGRYLVVLRRQADGGWKIVADIGNSPTTCEPDVDPCATVRCVAGRRAG